MECLKLAKTMPGLKNSRQFISTLLQTACPKMHMDTVKQMSDHIELDAYDLIGVVVPILKEKSGVEASLNSARSGASGQSSGSRRNLGM